MHDPFFFGYGSLVNRPTHTYPHAHRARVRGWRRVWRSTSLRELAFLTVERDEAAVIDGLIAAVPGRDWAALDQRERAYDRHVVAEDLEHEAPHAVMAHIYAVSPQHSAPPDVRHPILLSYIDVVVQGYLAEYGIAGAERFFETTGGWDSPVLNDRSNPLYPRHQQLDAEEKLFVDMHLARLPAQVVQR